MNNLTKDKPPHQNIIFPLRSQPLISTELHNQRRIKNYTPRQYRVAWVYPSLNLQSYQLNNLQD